jgi:hypothetical protein
MIQIKYLTFPIGAILLIWIILRARSYCKYKEWK